MTLKIDKKIEGKLTCAFKNDFGKYAYAEITKQQI